MMPLLFGSLSQTYCCSSVSWSQLVSFHEPSDNIETQFSLEPPFGEPNLKFLYDAAMREHLVMYPKQPTFCWGEMVLKMLDFLT